MTTATYEGHTLIKLESPQILPTAFPTRLWTGAGPLLLDVGDGNGTANWVGTTLRRHPVERHHGHRQVHRWDAAAGWQWPSASTQAGPMLSARFSVPTTGR